MARVDKKLPVARLLQQAEEYLTPLARQRRDRPQLVSLAMADSPAGFAYISHSLSIDRVTVISRIEAQDRPHRNRRREMARCVGHMRPKPRREWLVRRGFSVPVARITIDRGVSRKAGKTIDPIPLQGDPEGAEISVFEHKAVQTQTRGDVQGGPIALKGIVEGDNRVDPAPNHRLSDEDRPIPAAKQNPAPPRRLQKFAA